MTCRAERQRCADGEDVAGTPLAAVEGCLAAHLAAAQRRFGAAALGVIDLPPLGSESIVGPQVRVCAALYFERELERAGLVPFVEALARGLAEGRLPLPLGRGVHRLAAIARNTDNRLVAAERDRMYRQVFGAGALDPADPFDRELENLAVALADIGRAERTRLVGDLTARVGVLAEALGQTLSDRGQGMVGFAAREIAAVVRESLELLADPDVTRVLGGGSPWGILARHARTWLGRDVAPGRNVARARSGFEILDWLGVAAPDVSGAARALTRSHPVVRAAEAWLAEVTEKT